MNHPAPRLPGTLVLIFVYLAVSACGETLDATSPSNAHYSLPQMPSGQRPGPDALYAAPPRAPQLENRPPWQANPILISGAAAYREGEFLYQDYLYDDHGAAGTADLSSQIASAGDISAAHAGTLSYPTDPVHANNAADLVEFRIRPLADSTAIRVTLNTLIDPEKVAFTIALGDSSAPVTWPFAAGVSSPAQLFVTVAGTEAVMQSAEDPQPRLPAPAVTVDLERRQFDLRIAHQTWSPGRDVVRIAMGVGLWDTTKQQYLKPGQRAGPETPGGAAQSGAALFNMAFRFDEPLPNVETLPGTPVDFVTHFTQNTYWRDGAQAAALAAGDVSDFHAEVDFGRLIDRVDDESGVPSSGVLNRIYPSSFELTQGVDPTRTCGRFPESCDGTYAGQLQPYALYIPDRAAPDRGWGLSLLLHALGENHNSYSGTHYMTSLGQRGAGTLVLTPLSRGADGDYTDLAELDLFEAWADVARHYALDPDWVTVSGYSMGAGGTYKLMTRWPDLVARGMGGGAVPQVEQGAQFEPLINLPLMIWVGGLDEGTPPTTSLPARNELADRGFEFVFDLFPTMDHLSLQRVGNWTGIAEFLGDHRVNRDPHQVHYVVDPRFDSERAGLIADHAYWISELRVRDETVQPTAIIRVKSLGFGERQSGNQGPDTSYGVLEDTNFGPLPYVRQRLNRSQPATAPTENRLIIEATNLARLTIDVQRARVDCQTQLDVSTDGPLEIALSGCARSDSFLE